MKKSKRSDYRAGCWNCPSGGEPIWEKANAMGLAAQHAKKYGHHTWVEIDTCVNFIGESNGEEKK